MTKVYLGLGANIDPEACLQAGIAALRQHFSQVRLSPVYQTQAIGIDGPDFLNMVVEIDCHLSLAELRAWIKQIETEHGRERNLPQPSCHRLDMDVLLFGDLVDAEQNLPRKDVLTRAYVLQPLADVAPELVYPGMAKTMAELWQESRLNQKTKQMQ
jgi:2-amino-4-hydroxy-6-hydroxymethyldihydropteridine diphosphokinase